MLRRPSDTSPPTYTAGEVANIFRKEGVTESGLAKWDEAGIFRPTYYYADEAEGRVQSREQRDAGVSAGKKNRGNPRRRYTFHDLLWMRLLFYVREELRDIPHGSRLPAKVLAELRTLDDTPPPATRLVFVGKDVYVLGERGEATCLTRPGQLAMRQLIEPAALEAEVRGRLHVLADRNEIRQMAEYPQPETEKRHANG
jgi:DNA-binding transcriptional MerR regulator